MNNANAKTLYFIEYNYCFFSKIVSKLIILNFLFLAIVPDGYSNGFPIDNAILSYSVNLEGTNNEQQKTLMEGLPRDGNAKEDTNTPNKDNSRYIKKSAYTLFLGTGSPINKAQKNIDRQNDFLPKLNYKNESVTASDFPNVIEPPCDFTTNEIVNLAITLSGSEGTNVAYYLTDDNGLIIQGGLANPNFGSLVAGGYLAFAVTSDGILGSESNIANLTSSDGCIAFSVPFEIVVCYSDTITTNDTISVVGVGGNISGGTCTTVLTDNSGSILATTNGTTANFSPQTVGEYFVYIFCSDSGTVPTVGQNVSAISTNGCTDWSAPYSILVQSFCSGNLSVSVSGDTTICTGSSAPVMLVGTASGGTAPYQYSWTALVDIPNGGFENGDLSGWTTQGTTTLSNDANEGTYAASINSNTGAYTDGRLGYTFNNLIPNQEYALSFYSKGGVADIYLGSDYYYFPSSSIYTYKRLLFNPSTSSITFDIYDYGASQGESPGIPFLVDAFLLEKDTIYAGNTLSTIHPGEYVLNVLDSNKCSIQKKIIITTNICVEICDNGIDDDGDGDVDCDDSDCLPVISSANSTNPDNCPNLNNGQIAITASGSNLEYSINNGGSYQSSNTFTDLTAGTYNIRVRNRVTDCYVNQSSTITLIDPICSEDCTDGVDNDGDGDVDCDDSDCDVPQITDVNLLNPSNCNSGEIAIIATGSNLEYSINGGGSYQVSNNFSGLIAGNYSVRVRNSITNCYDDYGMVTLSNIVLISAFNDSLTSCPDIILNGNVAFNDICGANCKYTIITQPSNGNVSLQSNGAFEYLPTNAICGNDVFTYQLCDTILSCCDTATVTLKIEDTTPPNLVNIPVDDTVSCDEILELPPLVTAYDNCPKINIDITEESTQGEDGCSLYDYALTRTWTATDACGNSNSESQVVEVLDVVAPDIYRIYTLPNGKKMVGGVMEFVNQNWKTINLPIDFETTPIILHQVVTSNDPNPVVSRIRNISVSQFELNIQEEEGNDGVHPRESVAWIAVEQGAQLSSFQMEANTLLLSDVPQQVTFQNSFPTNPLIFAAPQTIYETDPFYLRNSVLTNNNVTLTLQEESSADAELTHTNESIGYLAIENIGDLREQKGILFGEVGTRQVNHNWQTITLNNSYANPVVIARSLSFNEAQSAVVDIKNIQPNSFEASVQEWDYLDGTHTLEDISYIVIEGSVPLESPYFCENNTDSLEIGLDIKAIDNCDVNVQINYNEAEVFFGAKKVVQRIWSTIDECGNSNSYSQEVICEGVSLKVKSILQGAILESSEAGLMRDDLRKKGLIPVKEPYSVMNRFQHYGEGGEEVLDSSLLNINGPNGIVDWVFIELRDPNNLSEIIATCSGLIECDGDIVSASGDSIIQFLNTPAGDYHVTVRHRNHLGMTTLSPYTFSDFSIPFVDFTYQYTPVAGANASIKMNNMQSFWAGDLNNDNKVIFQGPNNDIFYMLLHILEDDDNEAFIVNYISSGYTEKDFNLDGKVIYQGPNNDRAKILFNTILMHPLNQHNFSNFIIYTDNKLD